MAPAVTGPTAGKGARDIFGFDLNRAVVHVEVGVAQVTRKASVPAHACVLCFFLSF